MNFLHSLIGIDIATRACVGAVCLFLVDVFGPNIISYQILSILVAADTGLAMMAAAQEKRVSSQGFLSGWSKILKYSLIIIAFTQLARIEGSEAAWELREYAVYFCAAAEMFSIIENAKILGLPVPSWIGKWIKEGKKKK